LPIYKLQVNGQKHEVDVDPEMPLLWLLRDVMGLVGTKYGCGIGQCGACTIHLDGVAVRSCLVRVSDVSSQPIKTIEGLADGLKLHPLQQEWVEQDVAQCGYCQAGQIMSAAALLDQKRTPSEDEIESALAGNYCRCGTYNRILTAVKTASKKMSVGYHDPNAQEVNA
jgi:isoquinoline 1-oxidoreductase alpha subunit